MGAVVVEADPTDEELCRRIARRDPPAFDMLVERYQQRAWRLARSMLGNDTDANDVSQDAFIRLYESAHRFDGRSRFSTWFNRILVNLCIDHYRRNRWWRKFIPLSNPDDPEAPIIDPPSPEPGPELETIRGAQIGQLREALGHLSPNQRAALLLHVHEGYTSREIAAVLNCSDNTARVHVHRAIAQLKKELKKD
jgi:RNA polymerase sigma-70 factor (ECF subfamily)